MRTYSWAIWFVGAGVWWIVAALAVHRGDRQRALGSLVVSVLFFCSGFFFQRNSPKR